MTVAIQAPITPSYAQTHLFRLIDEVASTGTPITIESFGVPKVKIIPVVTPTKKRQMGTLKGKINIPNNFDTAFADEISDMFGGD